MAKQQRVQKQSSALDIVEEIKIGRVEFSETKAMSVSLIRTAAGYRYVAIWRMNRDNTKNDWTFKSKIWIPFSEAQKNADVISHAYNEGLKLGWNSSNTHKIERMNYTFQSTEIEDKKKQQIKNKGSI